MTTPLFNRQKLFCPKINTMCREDCTLLVAPQIDYHYTIKNHQPYAEKVLLDWYCAEENNINIISTEG